MQIGTQSGGARQRRRAGTKRNIRKYGRQTYTAEPDRSRRRSPAAIVLSVCLACCLTVLLSEACLLLYTSVFSLTGSITVHMLFLTAVSVALTLIMYLPWGGWWYLLHAAVLLLPAFFMKKRLLGGFRIVYNEITEIINSYFNISISKITIDGLTVWDNESHIFLLYLLTLCIWPMAYGLVRRRRPFMVLLPPVLFVALPLAIGKTPGSAALVVFFLSVVGTLGYLAGGVRQDGRRMVFGPGNAVVCICLAAAVLAATWSMTYERAHGLVENRSEIEDMMAEGVDYAIRTVEGLPGGFSWFGLNDPGRISNSEPRYRNEEVLRLTVSELPENTVYLRGYVGDTYEHGKWTNEGDSGFEAEAAGWGEDGQTAAASYVQSMPAHNHKSMLHTWMHYQVEYTDPPRAYAYLPYYTDTASAVDGVTGDTAELEFTGDSIVERNGQAAIRLRGYRDNSLLSTQIGLSVENEEEFARRYDSYAGRYTQVDDGLRDLKTLGSSLRGRYESEYASYVEQAFSWQITMEDSSQDAAREQLRKLICISLVQEELWKRSYDLDLDRVPFGQDVVEYFLFQGEKGFCEHFASAGVLLLREMGVPARYVSGYSVRVSDFTLGEDQYTAVVMDNRAHAWAEVYMDGVGWIPVEMTPGNSDSAQLKLIKQGYTLQIREGDGIQGSARVLYSDQPEDNESSESTETARPDTQMQETERQTQTEAETEQPQERQESGKPDPGDDSGKNMILWLAAAAVLLGAVAAAVFVYRRIVLAGRRISYASPGRAVEHLSGEIYRLLRRQGFIHGKIGSDAEFRRQLLEQSVIEQAEIIRYLEIIEKAAYSRQEITAVEAEFCRRFCRRLRELQNRTLDQDANRSPGHHKTRRRSLH